MQDLLPRRDTYPLIASGLDTRKRVDKDPGRTWSDSPTLQRYSDRTPLLSSLHFFWETLAGYREKGGLWAKSRFLTLQSPKNFWAELSPFLEVGSSFRDSSIMSQCRALDELFDLPRVFLINGYRRLCSSKSTWKSKASHRAFSV